jgi:phosphatidylserine/phosphatidylglycerophosphate/cardiolipin synthase-like enzyme
VKSLRWILPGTLFILIAAILILGANRYDLASLGSRPATTGSCLQSLQPPPSATTGVFVEPDDGYDPVLDELNRAQCEIDLSIYLLSDDLVMDALAAADQRGVRVRVQLEEDPFGGGWTSADDKTAWLDEAGTDWRWTPAHFRFSHAKYMVIDRQVAVIMNLNLSASAFDGNREFGIVSTDPAIVEEANQIFDADWSDKPLTDSLERVVTSPENSRAELLEMLASAGSSIDLYAEVIRDDAFVAALGDAAQRGVQIRLIVNESSDPLDQEVYTRLAATGVEIRFSGRLYIHAKLLTVDDRLAFIGSQNPTANSFDNNREVGVMVHDTIGLARCISVFERDWATGIPASPA